MASGTGLGVGARRVRRLRSGHQCALDLYQGHAVPGICRKREADFSGQSADPGGWLEESGEIWTIRFTTGAGNEIRLENGGRKLSVNGALVLEHGDLEYSAMYDRFADLLERHESDVDAAPLRLMADVFLLGARVNGPDFAW
jgi:hypothetical protein